MSHARGAKKRNGEGEKKGAETLAVSLFSRGVWHGETDADPSDSAPRARMTDVFFRGGKKRKHGGCVSGNIHSKVRSGWSVRLVFNDLQKELAFNNNFMKANCCIYS